MDEPAFTYASNAQSLSATPSIDEMLAMMKSFKPWRGRSLIGTDIGINDCCVCGMPCWSLLPFRLFSLPIHTGCCEVLKKMGVKFEDRPASEGIPNEH